MEARGSSPNAGLISSSLRRQARTFCWRSRSKGFPLVKHAAERGSVAREQNKDGQPYHCRPLIGQLHAPPLLQPSAGLLQQPSLERAAESIGISRVTA
jgi:hypothetical protein